LSRIELSSDPTICSHLAALYNTLLEQNLLWIVEPYLVVEIEYVAQQVGQGQQGVEPKYVIISFLFIQFLRLTFLRRLSQMILDKVFHGVLDQGRGCLLVFDEPEADVSPSQSLTIRYCYLIPPCAEYIQRSNQYARTTWESCLPARAS
jgi:26S proteasome regulatory subunit N6